MIHWVLNWFIILLNVLSWWCLLNGILACISREALLWYYCNLLAAVIWSPGNSWLVWWLLLLKCSSSTVALGRWVHWNINDRSVKWDWHPLWCRLLAWIFTLEWRRISSVILLSSLLRVIFSNKIILQLPHLPVYPFLVSLFFLLLLQQFVPLHIYRKLIGDDYSQNLAFAGSEPVSTPLSTFL